MKYNRSKKSQRTQTGQPSQAVMEAVATEAETTGCSACGSRFAQGLPYFVLQLGDAIKPRCPNCLDGGPVLGVATYYGGGDPWAADDRAWFAERPKRHLRLRELWKGELEAMYASVPKDEHEVGEQFIANTRDNNHRLAILVYQIEPGKRMRSLAGIPGSDPFDSYTEAGIQRLLPQATASDLNESISLLGGAETAQRMQMNQRLDLMKDLVSTLK